MITVIPMNIGELRNESDSDTDDDEVATLLASPSEPNEPNVPSMELLRGGVATDAVTGTVMGEEDIASGGCIEEEGEEIVGLELISLCTSLTKYITIWPAPAVKKVPTRTYTILIQFGPFYIYQWRKI